MSKMELENETENVYLMKFIVIGPKDSGLVDFLNRLHKTRQDFSETLGINIFTEKIFNDGRVYQINLWNITEAPNEKAREARSLFTQGSHGVLIMFNGNDPEGLEKIKPLVQEIDEIVQFNVPRVLVGNMVNDRAIKFEDAQKFAKEHHLLFAERYKYDIKIVLLSLCLLSLKEPIPPIYQQIFGDNYYEYLEKKLNIKPSDLMKEEVACEECDIWKNVWDKMWRSIKEEEEFVIDQRLARLDSDLNQVISDFYTTTLVLSPLLELFEITAAENTNFPNLLRKWLEESPEKVDALRKFLNNEENIQEKYWQDFYELREKMFSHKIQILQKFHEQIGKIISDNKETLEKIQTTLKSEGIPKRVSVDMAETVQFVDELIRKSKSQ